LHAALGGQDVCECCLAETRWSAKQQVVERFMAALGGLDEDLEVLLVFGLTDVVCK
jgi:hypothetical protein